MGETIQELLAWIRAHPAVLWWAGAASLMMFLATLFVVPIVLVKMPADYFRSPLGETPDDWRLAHPLLRWMLWGTKNGLGAILVLVGIVLLVLPGQGLLTILLGITLLDLPGKRPLEIALLRRPGVSRAVNWLRRRYGHPPLQMPSQPTSTE